MGEKERPGSASAEIGKYLDILAKDPTSRVFAPLAEAYRKAGLLDDAIETALEGLKVHPNYLGGRVALGRAYFEKRQYAEAAAEMQKVVKAAPDNLMAHKVLGQIAYGQNDLAAAEKAFTMVLMLDPRDQEARQFVTSIGGGTPSSAAAPSAPASSRPAAAPQPAPQAMAASAGEVRSRGDLRITGELPPIAATRPAVIPEDLTIEDISLDSPIPDFGALEPPALPEPASPERSRPEAYEVGAAELPEIDFSEEELEPPPLPDLPSPPPRPEPGTAWGLETFTAQAPLASPAAAEPTAPPAPAAMELEVFARVPWGKGKLHEPAAPESPLPASVGAADAPVQSPFEVFGRPKPGGVPPSTKGEQQAYAEIELEPTAHAPVEVGRAEAADSPFEVFTREPRGGKPKGTEPRAGREEDTSFRDIQLETTAYLPETPVENGAREEPVLSLEEELPQIDLAREVGLGQFEEPPAPGVGRLPAHDLASGPAPGLERWAPEPVLPEDEPFAPTIENEGDVAGAPGLDASGAGATPDSGEMPVPGAAGEEVSLEEELPQIDLAREVEPEIGGIESPGIEPAPEEDRSPPRGVFDTETLAAIYTDQGFYGRAAEIYQRLLADRAGDPGLLQKLEEVRALERMEQGKAATVAGPAETPAGAEGGADERVRRLQTLLEAFREGRPQ